MSIQGFNEIIFYTKIYKCITSQYTRTSAKLQSPWMHMYFYKINANFNISAAVSKSAGLFKISNMAGWRHPQGDKISLEIPLDFWCQKAKIPGLVDDLMSQELIEFLFTRRQHVFMFQCFSEFILNVYKWDATCILHQVLWF